MPPPADLTALSAACKSTVTSVAGTSLLKPVAFARSALKILPDTGLGCTAMSVFIFSGIGSNMYSSPVRTSTLASLLLFLTSNLRLYPEFTDFSVLVFSPR